VSGRAAAQRRTIRTLVVAQVLGSLGVGAAVSVGSLLAEDLAGSASWAGTAATMTTLGAALWALPLARLAGRRGRRPALSLGWGISAAGAVLAIVAAQAQAFALLVPAFLLMGAGNAANLQSRFAATDLSEAVGAGRALAIVVWATTLGAVAGPNLTSPGAAVADGLGIPDLAGPFVFTAAAGALAAGALLAALRPDPLLLARAARPAEDAAGEAGALGGTGAAEVRRAPGAGVARPWPAILASPGAQLALVATIGAHAVMLAVMAMTPVHMSDSGSSLTLVGLTISLHIAGMFAFSPLVGIAADRWGRIPVIGLGQLLLLAATVTCAVAGATMGLVTAGLVLLGLGWSCSLVAGSTLLGESVALEARPAVQGLSDLLMNLAGAGSAALAGVVLTATSFAGLNLLAALLCAPVILLALRPGRAQPAAGAG
jgi:MFS family permease